MNELMNKRQESILKMNELMNKWQESILTF